MTSRIFLPLLVIFSLSACASGPEASFPSLAKRPAEDAGNDRQPSPPREVAQSLNAELAAKLSAFESRIRKVDTQFDLGLSAMRSRANAARGAARSSEIWVDAHLQLSRFDRSRNDGLEALAELDQMITEQMDRELAGSTPLYGPLLQQKQAQLSAIIRTQSEEVERLGRIIGY